MALQLSVTNTSGRPIRDLLLVNSTPAPPYHHLALHSRELGPGVTAVGFVDPGYSGGFHMSFFQGAQGFVGEDVRFKWASNQNQELQPIEIRYSRDSFAVAYAWESPLQLKAIEHRADLPHEVIWVTPQRTETPESTKFELEFSGPYRTCFAVDRDSAEKTFFFVRARTAEKVGWDVKLRTCSFRYRGGEGPWKVDEVEGWLKDNVGKLQDSKDDPADVVGYRLPGGVLDQFKRPEGYKSILLDYTLDVGIDPEVEMESGS